MSRRRRFFPSAVTWATRSMRPSPRRRSPSKPRSTSNPPVERRPQQRSPRSCRALSHFRVRRSSSSLPTADRTVMLQRRAVPTSASPTSKAAARSMEIAARATARRSGQLPRSQRDDRRSEQLGERRRARLRRRHSRQRGLLGSARCSRQGWRRGAERGSLLLRRPRSRRARRRLPKHRGSRDLVEFTMPIRHRIRVAPTLPLDDTELTQDSTDGWIWITERARSSSWAARAAISRRAK